jgi:hypothetical protein
MKRETFHYLSFPKYEVLIEFCLVVFIKDNVGAVNLFKKNINYKIEEILFAFA